MNKKKLPKAIIQTAEGFSHAASGAAANELRPAPLTNAANKTVSREVEGASNVIPITPAAERSSVLAPAAPNGPAAKSENRERRMKALGIVNRHAAYSAAGGLIPLPVANFAGVTAVIVRMMKVLSQHYRVPFQRDRARAIVVGLVGGAIPSGAAAVTGSALLYVLPPSVLIVAAVSSVAAAGYTRSIGRIFIEHFETGATLQDFPAVEPR
jgi:uncharacterized protein (DUF697 family)